MNAAALQSLGDADTVLVLFDLTRPPTEDDERVVERLRESGAGKPWIVALNKVDAVRPEDLAGRFAAFEALLPGTEPLPISAGRGDNRDLLLERVVASLPAGPEYYPDGQLSDLDEREIAADLIRAAALQVLRDEVPHCTAVRIEDYRDRGDTGAYVAATLLVERESQKAIVIGKAGSMLRELGTLARQQIEAMSGRKVYLDLRVKVLPGWRNDERALRRLGFGGRA
jgi:GTP-binding protein Era